LGNDRISFYILVLFRFTDRNKLTLKKQNYANKEFRFSFFNDGYVGLCPIEKRENYYIRNIWNCNTRGAGTFYEKI